MSKVTFEFDESEDSQDIKEVVYRSSMMSVLYDIQELYRQLYNGKIYDPEAIVYITNDNKIATDEDYKKALEQGKPLSGKGYYINQEWLEVQLDQILDSVKHLID